MRIDAGAPIEFGKSGIFQRLKKLDFINKINYENCLDLGAGKGAYSDELSKLVNVIYSVDINHEFIKICRRINNPKLVPMVASAEELPIVTNVVHSVFLIETLEHIENLQKAVSEISRVSKQGAIINITVPYKYFILETHHVYIFGKTVDGRYFPILPMISSVFKLIGAARRFSIKDLNKIFSRSEYELIGYTYMLPPFDNIPLFKKIVNPLTKIIEKGKLHFLCPTLIAVYKKL